jgi:FecR protein
MRDAVRTICLRFLPILVVSSLLTFVQSGRAATVVAAQPPAKPPSTYPQIVRLSYVEGDVRVSRGKDGEKADEKESGATTGWEQAVADLPLEGGYSLVTGKGRAEIEFEDASTVYLGDNSVLSFSELSVTSGVPRTVMALLSGTASLNVQPMAPGEWFILNTPTDSISLRYPQKAYLRVNSYLDAVTITPQSNLTFLIGGSAAPRTDGVGQTQTFSHGRRNLTAANTPAEAAEAAEWDKWVATRVKTRSEAMSAAMKESGLSAPIPGLAEMNGQGRFFPCEPYGTCWEPAKGWDGHATDVAMVKTTPGTVSTGGSESSNMDEEVSQAGVPQVSGGQVSGKPAKVQNSQVKVQNYQAAHPGADLYTEDDFFPCSPQGVRYLIGRDPITGKESILDSEFLFSGFAYGAGFPYGAGYPGMGFGFRRVGYGLWGADPWSWAVCHTGSWIHRDHRYLWVAGGKRHHHGPVRWVKCGRSTGWVPIHPHDVAGKTPINLKYGMFVKKDGERPTTERVDAEGGKLVKVLDETPKEFRRQAVAPLESAAVPHAEGHAAFDRFLTAQGFTQSLTGKQGTPITFDRKSQTFMVARQTMEGGRPGTVVEPLGGHVNFQRSGDGSAMVRTANAGGGEYRGSTNSGGASRAPSSSGGSGSGGSFHGGGGESHGGGGGGGFSGGGGGGGGTHSGGGGGGGASGGGGGGHK